MKTDTIEDCKVYADYLMSSKWSKIGQCVLEAIKIPWQNDGHLWDDLENKYGCEITFYAWNITRKARENTGWRDYWADVNEP